MVVFIHGWMSLVETFGANIRSARNEREWTQEKLAFEAGVKRAYISEIEAGKRNPTLGIVERISSALGVEPSDLLRKRRPARGEVTS